MLRGVPVTSRLNATEFVQLPPVEQPDCAPLFQIMKGTEFIEEREQLPAIHAVPTCPAQGQPGAFVSPAFTSNCELPGGLPAHSPTIPPVCEPAPRSSSIWIEVTP